MLGIIVELIISFLLLKYLSGNNLNVLGFKPNKLRIAQFIIGILWPIAFYCIYEFFVAWLVHNPYKINSSYKFIDLLHSIAYLWRTVAYEELIFRGALLYILIKNLGAQKAIVISASAFGIYHWFAWQAFGNPFQMLMIFYITASGGFLFAMAYKRTGAIYLQSGLHFGCDFATMIIFSKNKSIGLQWLIKSSNHDAFVPAAFVSVIVLIVHFTGFQLLTYFILKKWRLLNKHHLHFSK